MDDARPLLISHLDFHLPRFVLVSIDRRLAFFFLEDTKIVPLFSINIVPVLFIASFLGGQKRNDAHSQISEVISIHHLQATVSRLEPEIRLALQGLIMALTVFEGASLPGMALMNLRFRDEGTIGRHPTIAGRSGVGGPTLNQQQRLCYIASALIKYSWTRLLQVALSSRSTATTELWRHGMAKAMRALESAYAILSLGNSLAFVSGMSPYRTLFERLIKVRLVYALPSAPRAVSYEYLNRQLVWSELGEVLLFLLPLVNLDAVKRAIRSTLPRIPAVFSAERAISSFDRSGLDEKTQSKVDGESTWKNESCPICGKADILQPYVTVPCQHEFCYFCLRSHVLAQRRTFHCPVCSQQVEAMRPVLSRKMMIE